MAATLSIRLSDAAFTRLSQRAVAQGTTPEALAAAELERELPKSASDPLMRCAGLFQSDVPDAAEKHDEYLGQALADEMAGRMDSADVR